MWIHEQLPCNISQCLYCSALYKKEALWSNHTINQSNTKLWALFMVCIVIHGSHWQDGVFTWSNHIFPGEPGKGNTLSACLEYSVCWWRCLQFCLSYVQEIRAVQFPHHLTLLVLNAKYYLTWERISIICIIAVWLCTHISKFSLKISAHQRISHCGHWVYSVSDAVMNKYPQTHSGGWDMRCLL